MTNETSSNLSKSTKTLLILAVLAAGMTIFSSINTLMSLLMSLSSTMANSDPKVDYLAEMQAEDHPIVTVIDYSTLVLSLLYSTAMGFGAVKWLMGTPNRILRPMLLFGALFEIVTNLWAVTYAFLYWTDLREKFAGMIVADGRDRDPEIAGTIAEITLFAILAGSLILGVIKAALFLVTRYKLRADSSGDVANGTSAHSEA